MRPLLFVTTAVFLASSTLYAQPSRNHLRASYDELEDCTTVLADVFARRERGGGMFEVGVFAMHGGTAPTGPIADAAFKVALEADEGAFEAELTLVADDSVRLVYQGRHGKPFASRRVRGGTLERAYFRVPTADLRRLARATKVEGHAGRAFTLDARGREALQQMAGFIARAPGAPVPRPGRVETMDCDSYAWSPNHLRADSSEGSRPAGPASRDAAPADTSLRVDEARVAAALRSPEALWAFVTAPETRWPDRMAAAWRAFPAEKRMLPGVARTLGESGLDVYGEAAPPQRFLLPASFLPRLVAARRELKRENAIHNWGLRRVLPPGSRAGSIGQPFPYRGERRRIVLGHVWMVPDSATANEPRSFQERRFGPWPSQVEGALDLLHGGLRDSARPDEYYAAVLNLPCDSAADAWSFVEETWTYASNARAVTPALVGVWRNIALNPAWPSVHGYVSHVLYSIGITRTDEAFWMGQALMADMAESRRDEDVHMLTIHLSSLDTDLRPGWDIQRPGTPDVAIWALARRVDALPRSVPPYQRREAAKDVLEVADSAAAAALPEAMQVDSVANERAFAYYRAWFAANRAALAARAARQERQVAAARAAMRRTRLCAARRE
jgi:hypothetical protein